MSDEFGGWAGEEKEIQISAFVNLHLSTIEMFFDMALKFFEPFDGQRR